MTRKCLYLYYMWRSIFTKFIFIHSQIHISSSLSMTKTNVKQEEKKVIWSILGVKKKLEKTSQSSTSRFSLSQWIHVSHFKTLFHAHRWLAYMRLTSVLHYFCRYYRSSLPVYCCRKCLETHLGSFVTIRCWQLFEHVLELDISPPTNQ